MKDIIELFRALASMLRYSNCRVAERIPEFNRTTGSPTIFVRNDVLVEYGFYEKIT